MQTGLPGQAAFNDYLNQILATKCKLHRKEAFDELKKRTFPTNADEDAAFAWIDKWIDDKCPAMGASDRAEFETHSTAYQHCLLAVATEISDEHEHAPTETFLRIWSMIAAEPEPSAVTAEMLMEFAVKFLKITTYPAPRLAAVIDTKLKRGSYYAPFVFTPSCERKP